MEKRKQRYFLILFIALSGALLLQPIRWAKAATVPSLAYTQGTDRTLLFVNNPEQITTADLGDSGSGQAIFRATNVQGKYRDFFEHVNETGGTIGYGIQLYNPTSGSVTVTVEGSGFTANSLGGQPFSQMLGSENGSGTTYTVDAGRSIWIMQENNAVSNGTFLSGVVDFTVSDGGVTVNNIAYANFNNLTGSTNYEGYITRSDNGTDEARLYKGISSVSSVTAASVDFTIDDSDSAQVLPVSYPSYDLNSGSYGTPVTHTGWFSNITPAVNSEAVTNDMVAFTRPEGGVFDPLTQSDARGKYPNLGNWGIVYTVTGMVTNNGSADRTLSVNLQAPTGAGVVLAYQGSDGVWRDAHLNRGSDFPYYTFTVAAGTASSYSASFVLGGPSGGNIHQTISITN